MLITSKYPLNVFLKPFMSPDALAAPHLKDRLLSCNHFPSDDPSGKKKKYRRRKSTRRKKWVNKQLGAANS